MEIKKKSPQVKAELTAEEKLIQWLKEHKYSNFDSEGEVFTRQGGKYLCRIDNLGKEGIRISINRFEYFEYPRLSYVFKDPMEFIKVNMSKLENKLEEEISLELEILYILIMEMIQKLTEEVTITNTLSVFEVQLIKLYMLYRMRMRGLNIIQESNPFNLEVKEFMDNNSH